LLAGDDSSALAAGGLEDCAFRLDRDRFTDDPDFERERAKSHVIARSHFDLFTLILLEPGLFDGHGGAPGGNPIEGEAPRGRGGFSRRASGWYGDKFRGNFHY